MWNVSKSTRVVEDSYLRALSQLRAPLGPKLPGYERLHCIHNIWRPCCVNPVYGVLPYSTICTFASSQTGFPRGTVLFEKGFSQRGCQYGLEGSVQGGVHTLKSCSTVDRFECRS